MKMIAMLRRRLVTFTKGLIMGISDVIPGVSGGTMALVLGIYERLIDAIKNIDLHWFKSCAKLLPGIGNHEKSFRQRILDLELHFLLPLGLGILTAIALGSQFIPGLLSNYPSMVRGFFFGLILASLWVPLKRVSVETTKEALSAVLLIVLGTLIGFVVTDPARQILTEKSWVTVQSRGEALESILHRGGSAMPAYEAFWVSQNQALRSFLRKRKHEVFQELKEKRNSITDRPVSQKEIMKARSAPYLKLAIPEGVEVKVPRLRLDYTFFAGFIAICAMILPGISGSYILLILGSYFFILNLMRGALGLLSAMMVPSTHLLYLSVFAIGAIGGLAFFSRVLGYFLHRWMSGTMAFLAGLMAGCLRGVWPFRRSAEGVMMNVLPGQLSSYVLTVIGSLLLGMVGMVGLVLLGELKPRNGNRVEATDE